MYTKKGLLYELVMEVDDKLTLCKHCHQHVLSFVQPLNANFLFLPFWSLLHFDIYFTHFLDNFNNKNTDETTFYTCPDEFPWPPRQVHDRCHKTGAESPRSEIVIFYLSLSKLLSKVGDIIDATLFLEHRFSLTHYLVCTQTSKYTTESE